MEIKLDNDLGSSVITALFEILDEEFNGVIKEKLKNTILYVVARQTDKIVGEIVDRLEKNELYRFVKIFKEDEFKDKEIVLCVSNGEGEIESIIAKINVENGNGYKTISAVHFLERVLRILQNKRVITPMSSNEEMFLVTKIINEVPCRVMNSEIVEMNPREKEYPRCMYI